MEGLAIALWILGGVLVVAGGVLFILLAFKENPLWGLAVFFLAPFGGLVFLIKYWTEARKPFFMQTAGVVILVVAGLFSVVCGAGTKFLGVSVSQEQAAAVSNIRGWLRRTEPVAEAGKIEVKDDYSPWQDMDFVGKRLKTVKELMGPPKGVLRMGATTTYFYADCELISEDGETVTRQAAPSDSVF